jgi:hypothetical protein
MARIATKGLFQPDMEKLFSEAEREAVGREFEGWVMENFTKEGGAVSSFVACNTVAT